MSFNNHVNPELKHRTSHYDRMLEKSKALFFTFIDSGIDLICLKDENFEYVFANTAFTSTFKVNDQDLIGLTDFDLMITDVAKICRITDQETITRNISVNTVETINDKIYDTRKFPVKMNNGKTGVGSYMRDNTDRHKQLEIMEKISQTNEIIIECMMKPFDTVQEQLDYALHEAIRITESEYGYIYLYDEKTNELHLNSWTNNVMPDCEITDKKNKYKLEKTGFWGEVIRQRKPMILNDFNSGHL